MLMMRSLLLVLCLAISVSGNRIDYDRDTGLEFYYYSNAVFCDDDIIKNWSCKYPCGNTTGMTDTRVVYNADNNIKGYVGYQATSDKIVVSFRGTQDIRNMIVDGTFVMINYEICPGCKIHQGFVTALHSVKPQLLGHINSLRQKHPSAKLYFTGHSLGAALTTIGAVEVASRGIRVDGLYTYGCPRVGNDHFAAYVSERIENTFRHVYNNDLYTHLPPSLLGFRQYTQEIWQSKDGKSYKLCSRSDGEDPDCSNSVSTLKLTPQDHQYYFNLVNNCDGE